MKIAVYNRSKGDFRIMVKENLKFDNVNRIKGFVDDMSKFDFRVSIEHDGFVVNAKSIMGIFSLDLTKPVIFRAASETEEDDKAVLECIDDLKVGA